MIEQRTDAATHQAGTLTIQANLTISPTGVITVYMLDGTAIWFHLPLSWRNGTVVRDMNLYLPAVTRQ